MGKTHTATLVSAAIAASLIGYAGGSRLFSNLRPPESEIQLRLVIPDEELELGRVYETSAREHVFHISNTSARPVTILTFETTCNCLGITPNGNVTLQPNETRSFAVKLSLASHNPQARWQVDEPYKVRFAAVYALDGQTQRSFEWVLNCTLVPTIRFRPSLYLGVISKRQLRIERSVEILATDEVGDIECAPSHGWTVEVTRKPSEAVGKRFVATIRSQGMLECRQVNDAVRLIPFGPNDQALPAKELKITGAIVEDVVSVPADVHFGRQVCGTSGVDAIRLHSLTNGKFQVKKAISRSGNVLVAPVANESGCFSIRCRFTESGNQETAADFVIEDEDGSQYSLLVPIRYCGTNAHPRSGAP
jgi:hypothetical protein